MKKILFLFCTACICFASCDEVEQAYEEVTSEPAQEIAAFGEVQNDTNWIVYRYDPAFSSAEVEIVNYDKIFKLISKNFDVIRMDKNQIKDFLDSGTTFETSLPKDCYFCLIKTTVNFKYINLSNNKIGNLEDHIPERNPIFIVISK
jgi:hypothetical protein